MDSDESLALIAETLALLKAVHQAFPSHLAREVLQTAGTLMKGLEKNKTKQARLLSMGSEIIAPDDLSIGMAITSESLRTENIQQGYPSIENWALGEMDWFQLVGNETSFGQMATLDTLDFP